MQRPNVYECSYAHDRRNHRHRCQCCNKIIDQTTGKNDNREIMRLAHAIAKHNKAQYGSKYTYAWLFHDALQGIYSNDIPVWKLRWNTAHGKMIKTSTSYKLW